jgi:PAS domain S-box-containing protein
MAKAGTVKRHPAPKTGAKRISRSEARTTEPNAREVLSSPPDFFAGGGEMTGLIRQTDWSRTPLGPIETWPQSLRTTVSLCLASNFPINIIWGPEHTQIYNDGYRVVCGEVHPRALGEDYSVTWASAWPAIGESFERALAGETMYLENQRMFLKRLNGALEETFFTFSHSPIRDESGGVGGLFHPVTETTATMLAERRTRALRELSASLGIATDEGEVAKRAVEVLSRFEFDLPFLLFYAFDPQTGFYRLTAQHGIAPGRLATPLSLERDAASPWPFTEALAVLRIVEVNNLPAILQGDPCGPYEEPPNRAFVVPIVVPAAEWPPAVVIAAVSPRLPFNDAYRSFFELLGVTISGALATVRAREDERKRAEALAEIDWAKTAFFSNVSHEFRTPLTLMLGPLEDALAGSDLPAGERERLDVAHRNSLRLLKLVNTLLDFSRIEAGRAQASYAPSDLAGLTAEFASNFRSTCEKAGVDLVVDCPPLPEPVHVDRDMWEKVVLNLVSNAFKFTFGGRIEVRLKARADAAELVVRDTGVGVPPAEVPRLFERFHRIEGQKGRSYEGSGIGLALVQELVRLHGGTISAKSKVGKGTTFTVTLPFGTKHLPADRIAGVPGLASTSLRPEAFVQEALRWLPDAATPSEPTYRAVQASAPSLIPMGSRPHVLVADDNSDMRDYMRHLLDGYYRVETVADGQTALDAIGRHRPDIVLADVMMPGLDGFGLLREIRANPDLKTAPVILVSARAGEEARLEGLEAGADDYLTKPFSARELIARIDGQLQLARVRGEAGEATKEEARTLEILNRVGSIVAAELDLERAVQAVTDAATQLTGAAFGSFFYNVLDEHGESYMLYALSGASREAFSKFPLPRKTAVFGPTFSGERIIRSDDILQDPRYGRNDPFHGMPEGHLPVRSYLAAPVISRSGEVLGGLFFAHPEASIFTERSERLLMGIAAQAAMAIDNGRLYQAAQAEIAQRSQAEQALRESEERLRHANTELTQRVSEFKAANVEVQDARRAALNLMEDALQSRQATETLNAQLQASEEKLREGERRFRKMVDALPTPIYTTDAEGCLTHFNPAAAEFSGRVPELGTDTWCVSSKLYHADGTPMPHDESPMAIALKEGRIIRGEEAILERPDGSRLWYVPYPTPMRDAAGRIVGGINMLVDITERKQAEQRQQFLMNELNHRVKNTLATVQSIAAQSLKGASDRELRTTFDARLISLSRTHDLLSRETWKSASLRELLLLELEPYRSEQGTRFVLEGPEITVNPKAALALGLAFHELATNAAKYGALSKPIGQVRVVWDVLKSSEPSTLRLKWTETGGPPVKKTGRKGFGTIVIERGLSMDLDGEVHVDFNPSGLVFTVDIPWLLRVEDLIDGQ